MENRDVVEVIKSNLNGDFEHDFAYLMKELSHFQRMQGSEAIVKGIIKLIEEHLGEKGQKRIFEIAKQEIGKRQEAYRKVIEFMKNKQFDEALPILTNLIDTFPVKKNENNPNLFNFQNIFESILYTRCLHPEITSIRQVEEPITNYYFHMAVILVEKKDFDKAVEMLEHALEYNPIYVEALILEADILRNRGNILMFMERIKEALRNSYDRSHLAKCYFLLAQYFAGLNDKEVAISFAVTAQKFLPIQPLDNFITNLNKMPGGEVRFSSPTEPENIIKNRGFQYGPSREVIETLDRTIIDTQEKRKADLEKYFLHLAYSLTQEKKYKDQIDSYVQ